MTDTELPPLERLQAIQLEAGDTLIVTLPEGASHDSVQSVSQLFARKFPDQDVVVISAGVTVEVARQEQRS